MDVGIDIVEIARIAKQIHNPRFLKRVFAPQEVAYCRSRKNSAQHFAVRFAAKEAVWKAISGEIARLSRGGAIASAIVRRPSGGRLRGATLLHRDIHIRNRPNGKPEVVFLKRFAKLARRVSISLSHSRDYAVAMAVYDRAEERKRGRAEE